MSLRATRSSARAATSGAEGTVNQPQPRAASRARSAKKDTAGGAQKDQVQVLLARTEDGETQQPGDTGRLSWPAATAGDAGTASSSDASAALLQRLLERVAAPAPQSATRAVEVRLRDVPRYKGESGDALDSWLATLDLRHRNWVGVQGAEERRFVAAVAECFEGAAVTWWMSLPVADLPANWAAMRASLQKQFQPVTADARARGDLFALKQGAKQPLVEYVAAFRRLLAKAGSELAAAPALVAELFVNGLRAADIRRDLKKEDVRQLDRAIEIATRLDGCDDGSDSSGLAAASASGEDSASSDLRTQIAALTHVVNAMAQQQQQQRSSSASASSGSGGRRYETRFDRGANGGPAGSIARSVPGLSEAVVKARREGNLCFWCGSKEHTKRDCPDRAAGKPPRLN
jgi:hypothetical protein